MEAHLTLPPEIKHPHVHPVLSNHEDMCLLIHHVVSM